MREIGGYIELEHYQGNEYHKGIALNSGRNCLRYLIKAKKIQKILIPDWCCRAIKDVCRQENVYMYYYDVKSLSQPYQIQLPSDDIYIYIINYFGQLDTSYIKYIREKHKNIIVDNAQDFFLKPIDGIDTIYTCRKYFGVADGAYLYTTSQIEERLNRDTSYDHREYLLGRYECGAKAYFNLYQENERQIGKHSLCTMSELTQNILKSINYQYVKKSRTNNFKILNDRLGEKNGIKIKLVQGAYMYPYMSQFAPMLRNMLIKKNIYIPMLWPESNSQYSHEIVPIPCDQRYVSSDMEYVINTIEEMEQLLE